ELGERSDVRRVDQLERCRPVPGVGAEVAGAVAGASDTSGQLLLCPADELVERGLLGAGERAAELPWVGELGQCWLRDQECQRRHAARSVVALEVEPPTPLGLTDDMRAEHAPGRL